MCGPGQRLPLSSFRGSTAGCLFPHSRQLQTTTVQGVSLSPSRFRSEGVNDTRIAIPS